MNLKTINVLGYPVFAGTLNDIDNASDKVLINTISPNSYGLATKDPVFENALKQTDALVLDGVGVALGSVILNGKNIKKIAGQDCFDHFMALSEERKWKVFFLGSTDATLSKIRLRAKQEFPNVLTQSYSPPYKPEFDQKDNELMIEEINQFKPDVLFIGLTAPKQEKWAFEHKAEVNTRIISTIGNVFDWYAGNSKRPSQFWIKLRLEWLVRIVLRPEIFSRNTKNQLIFLKDVMKKRFELNSKG